MEITPRHGGILESPAKILGGRGGTRSREGALGGRGDLGVAEGGTGAACCLEFQWRGDWGLGAGAVAPGEHPQNAGRLDGEGEIYGKYTTVSGNMRLFL